MSGSCQQLEAARKRDGEEKSLRRFKPYPTYQESGVEWLGDIPAHWKCLSLTRVSLSRCDGPFGSSLKSEHYASSGVRVVRLQNIGWAAFLDSDQVYIDEGYARELGNHDVVDGDLLIAGLGDDGHPVGRACMAPEGIEPAIVKADCFRFRLDRTHVLPRFASYQLSATASSAAGSLATGATRSRMNLTTTASRKVALPPFEEQRAISLFLDQETTKIDALVEKREQLIELLQEQRSACITHAITKGLDPTVRIKDSRIEWLGDIPAHWRVKRLKFLLTEQLKYGANEAAELDDPDLPRYVRITDIDESDSLRKDTFKSLPADVAEEYLLREGDLLFARSGATAGKTFLYRRTWGKCAYAGYLIRARLDTTRACPEFVRYFTASSSYWQWLSAAFIQATIQNVSAEKYASLVMPQPPYPEQRTIADHLDREVARIDTLVAKVRDAIERLNELRTALISAAVTGKIDVREETA